MSKLEYRKELLLNAKYPFFLKMKTGRLSVFLYKLLETKLKISTYSLNLFCYAKKDKEMKRKVK